MLGKKFKRIKVQSQAAAERKISRIRFRPTFGSGYLHKDFDLYVNRPNTPTPERLATFTWISSAPVTLSDGSSPGELKTDLGGFIDLDDYSDFFFTVSIMDPWNTYSRAQKVEVYGEDFSLSSNETGVGDHFFVNGKFLDVDE